jgi:AAA domain (dynein-related subfamily)
MAVDFKTFDKIVKHITDVKKPVLIRGRHGIGKSHRVYQYAESVGMKVVERRASQLQEGDLIGLPVIDGNSTKFNPPDWFKDCCDHPRVLFLDEVDRATLEVRQGIFELTDSRKLNGHTLHPETVIFAAVNGGAHGAQYQVGEMDPAELDRWTVFDLEPSVEDWLAWAKGNCDSLVWDFINQNRGHLEHKGEYEPNKVYPSRRSWARLNECLSVAGFFSGDAKANLAPIYEIGCAFVGFEAAVAFRDFVDKYERQVTVEDILAGRLDKTSAFTINDHTAMADKIIASGMFTKDMTDTDIEAVAKYALTMPSEVCMKFWRQASGGNVKNTVRLHEKMSDRIVQILNPAVKK